MSKKVLSAVLILTLFVLALSGCGGVKSSKDTLNLIIGPEPDTIDPALCTTADSITYVAHMFEGLTKVDKSGETIPGTAKDWEISKDKLTYTFHIRKDAKWSDGVPVKAQDFEYAWKRVLDPQTASPYAYQLYYIKNAAEYNQGNSKADEVGVKAADESTLIVTLNVPVAYFLGLTNFVTYMPVRKDLIEKQGDKWTQSGDSYIGNGAYKMVNWKHKDIIEMTKNENYWDSKNIAINNLKWKLIGDKNAAYNAYDAGEVDALLNDMIPSSEIKSLVSSGKAQTQPLLSTTYIQLNVKKAPFDNLKVRHALGLALDRSVLKRVGVVEGKPAVGFVPYSVPGASIGKDFRSEAENSKYILETADVNEAKKMLTEAGFPDGKGFPTVEISVDNSEGSRKVMESIQQQWKTNLGINVKISAMEWTSLMPKIASNDFDLAGLSWVADYADPMTFLGLFATDNGNNNTGYTNTEFEKLIKQASETDNQEVRMKAMHDAEKILLNDMPMIPLLFGSIAHLENPALKGVYHSPLGTVYMHYAYIE
ncbi:MAG: peptide ABC transporter substrate-binding protein [Clostridia bacterium]|nr:peptide ABC transporter substrate-binding protein [Clostridia bacterium]